MIIEIHKQDSPYDGLWLNEMNYMLIRSALPDKAVKDAIKIGLVMIADDVWTLARGGTSDWSWEDMVQLSVDILNSEMTHLFRFSMWLGGETHKVISKKIETTELPNHQVSNGRKIYASCAWKNWRNDKQEMLGVFRFSSKDTQEPAIGTWLHWIHFATKVLANKNTLLVAPKYYCREIEIK